MRNKLMKYNKFWAAVAGALLLYAQQELGVDFGVAQENVPSWAVGAFAALGVVLIPNRR